MKRSHEHRPTERWGPAVIALALAGCCAPPDDAAPPGVAVQPATFGNKGLLDVPAGGVGACFVVGPVTGFPALSPVTQDQVDIARNTIDEWTQGWTSLRFNWNATVASLAPLTIGRTTYLTNCARAADGTFTTPLRIYLDHRPFPPSTVRYPSGLTIPGCEASEQRGTQKLDENGNPVRNSSGLYLAVSGMWGWFPDEARAGPRCLYTAHLVVGQARNNYLHESGHMIGLAHEHLRSDATCVPPTSPGGGLFVTRYDVDSVMHYEQDCADGTHADGNFGTDGLSDSDRLGAEVLYPANATARVWGSVAGWSGAALGATSAWVARGAYVAATPSQNALLDFEWRVDGSQISTNTRPTASEWADVSPGRHTLELRFRDQWDHAYVGTVTIDVLPTQQDYLQRAAATVTAVL